MKIRIEDNSKEFLSALKKTLPKSLKKIGLTAERYAKKLCPVGTPESTGKPGYRGGTLRNSITHEVGNNSVTIGSNVEYAPYVELGTGPYFDPPPEWEKFTSKRGSGKGHGYVHPRPYLRPAIEDHKSEYEDIFKNDITNA